MRVGVARAIAGVGALVVAACGPPPPPRIAIAPSPAQPPATASAPPAPAPAPTPVPVDPSAWTAIEASVVPCPDGGDECVAVTLPARGFLRFEGATPHYWGCASYDDGVIVATVGDRTLTLMMTSPGRDPHGDGQCRALAVLRGQGTAGPLAAGTWLVVRGVPDGRQPDNLAPLALRQLTFAAAP